MEAQQPSKISQTDTTNILRHATARSSTKEIATLIGVAPSRVSEGKAGKWRLDEKSAKEITDEYGQPLAKAGVYLECEVWDSLQDLWSGMDSVSQRRQALRAHQALKNEALDEIIKKCFDPHGYGSNDYTIENCCKLLSDPDFECWFQEYKASAYGDTHLNESSYFLHSPVKTNKGLTILDLLTRYSMHKHAAFIISQGTGKHDPWNSNELAFLFLAELFMQTDTFKTKLPTKIESFSDLQLNLINPPTYEEGGLQDIVITGDIIWNESYWLPEDKQMSGQFFCDLPTSKITERYTRHNSHHERWLIATLPDLFNHVHLRIALNKDLNYHLILTLSLQRSITRPLSEHKLVFTDIDGDFIEAIPSRTMVIKQVKSEDLLAVIHEIHNLFKLTPPSIGQLKQKIAENGGYLHGALYLE